MNFSWMTDKILLENPKFVELVFEIAIKDISENIQPKDLQELLNSANLKSVSEDLKTSINAVLREASGNSENKLNDRVRKSLAALTSLPLGYIASFGDNPLVIILGKLFLIASNFRYTKKYEKFRNNVRIEFNKFPTNFRKAAFILKNPGQ